VAESLSQIDRRKLVFASAVLATAGVVGTMIYNVVRPAPRTDEARRPRRGGRKVTPANVSPEELMKPGPMPELVIGKPDAPVTIVEYASMTCSHCASFHNNVLPALKEKYIDKGQVKLIFREFPLDDRAALASMTARCAGPEKALPLISALFARQDDWAQSKSIDELRGKLFAYGQQTGLTKQAFDACIPMGNESKLSPAKEKLLTDILMVRKRANETFGVAQTPTFFINGKKLDGVTIEDFDKAIAPLIKG
jgi:protein-disulfide isomerase